MLRPLREQSRKQERGVWFPMIIFKAIFRGVSAFCASISGKECAHERVSQHKHGAFCPDCGYQIRMMWAIVRCRTCGVKRLPKPGMDGRVSPLYKYCQDCGAVEYRIIKKEKIHAHEMAFALSCREVDYSEGGSPAAAEKPVPDGNLKNPFLRAFDVVEGEVLGSRYVRL